MEGTIWALLPPILAIALALITKEVYISLLVGILSGALLFTHFHVITAVETTFDIMGGKISSNADILIFLVLLGILVALITMSGASRSYGEWATRTIKTKRGALAATSCLGVMIFVDDYFNCLTVGTVMRPVTDRYHITRPKLAYIIDATAAPVCIIAPISSWAAAVSTSLPKDSSIDGFSLFLNTIPYNQYAIFTIIFVVFMIFTGIDFSKMKKYEIEHQHSADHGTTAEEEVVGHGKVIDLILPIAVLIAACILAMIYTGGFFDGVGLKDAFANCTASRALVLGSFFALVFTFLLYIPRRVISFTDFCSSFVSGFKAMTPAIMILCLAWSLSGICSEEYLDIGFYVQGLIGDGSAIMMVMPFVFFLISLGLAFATGTSWGTFGILIPIAVSVFGAGDMLTVCVASILSGAVCGDHISPISDTTILSSAGANCLHIDHVSTQIPYALLVAACCGVGFLSGGILDWKFPNAGIGGWSGLGVGFVCLVILMTVLKLRFGEQKGERVHAKDL